MTDQTPDLAALAALAEAATPGPWRVGRRRDGHAFAIDDADGYSDVVGPGPVDCMAYCYGGVSTIEWTDATAAYVAAADPQTVLWLIREVRRLREPLDDLEIINGWLVQRGVHEPEYPAGVGYGPMPYSDAEPLVDLSTLSGWPDITRAEKAEATIARVRELADSWAGSRSDLGPLTRACGALLRAALDGGEPDA